MLYKGCGNCYQLDIIFANLLQRKKFSRVIVYHSSMQLSCIIRNSQVVKLMYLQSISTAINAPGFDAEHPAHVNLTRSWHWVMVKMAVGHLSRSQTRWSAVAEKIVTTIKNF